MLWSTVLLTMLSAHAVIVEDFPSLPQYDVSWTSLLPEDKDTWVNTMPLGNGDTALNVWAENATGSILMLLAKAEINIRDKVLALHNLQSR